MQYSKKNSQKKSQLSKKKVRDINPRDYTIMGAHPNYVHFSPAADRQLIQPISHSLEKWILMILLAFAMAAFTGFKLLENSDLAFSLTDGSSESFAASSLSNDKDFKEQFNKNSQEAQALMAKHRTSYQKKTPKYGKGTKKYYAKKATDKKSKKKIARKLPSKKKMLSKNVRKKAVARK